MQILVGKLVNVVDNFDECQYPLRTHALSVDLESDKCNPEGQEGNRGVGEGDGRPEESSAGCP